MAKMTKEELAQVDGVTEQLETFEPKNLKEELLTYADVHVKRNEIVTFEERFRDVIERSIHNPTRLRALQEGKERIKKIVDKIDHMLISQD